MRDIGGPQSKMLLNPRLAEKDSLPISVLELDVTNAPRSNGLGGRRHQSRSHRPSPSTTPAIPLGGGGCHHRTSPASRGYEFFGPVRVNRRRASAYAAPRSGVPCTSAARWTHRCSFHGFLLRHQICARALAESYHYELAGQGMNPWIVEPGAYETPVFRHTVMAADDARTIRMVPSSRSLQNSTGTFLHGGMLRKSRTPHSPDYETPAGRSR